MSNRPTDKPYWATDDETDPTYGTNNKEEPSQSKQDYGQKGNENTLRQDINYLFNKIREWIDFFDAQYSVGDVYLKEGTTTLETEISDQLGGTWHYLSGNIATSYETIGSIDVQFFEKTSEDEV